MSAGGARQAAVGRKHAVVVGSAGRGDGQAMVGKTHAAVGNAGGGECGSGGSRAAVGRMQVVVASVRRGRAAERWQGRRKRQRWGVQVWAAAQQWQEVWAGGSRAVAGRWVVGQVSDGKLVPLGGTGGGAGEHPLPPMSPTEIPLPSKNSWILSDLLVCTS